MLEIFVFIITVAIIATLVNDFEKFKKRIKEHEEETKRRIDRLEELIVENRMDNKNYYRPLP